MNCKILHESEGRLRVRVKGCHMYPEEADKLEAWLRRLEGVKKASVNERTLDAVIVFRPSKREAIVRALAQYDKETTQVSTVDHKARQIRREFQDKLLRHIAGRLFRRAFLPLPARTVWTAATSLPYFARGLKSLGSKKLDVPVLDMASIGVSMAQSNFDTAANIMFLLRLGDIIEEWTHKKSVADLAEAMSVGVDQVWLERDGTEVLVSVSSVEAGDVIVVRAGSQIPLDGVVASGEAMVNQASMTGESKPVHKREGLTVYAGTVIEDGCLHIRVHNAAGASRYDRIVKMIEEGEKLKSSAEMRATRLADRLVPYTFGATLLTLALTRNVSRATSILMVDFCCALKLSMPIAVLSAMREAGDNHMSVKGGKFMEAIAAADTIVFDKTGTLTHAQPRVAKVVPFMGRDENEVLRLAACLEEHFPHSMANAVVAEAKARGLHHAEKHSKVEYMVAHGIASSVHGQRVLIGSHHFVFEDEGCTIAPQDQPLFQSLPDQYSHLFLAEEGKLAAVICIEDPVRADAARTIQGLRREGFTNIVMMTGDSDRTARDVAVQIGVDRYYSEVLPEDKAAFVQAEHDAGRKVIMIGDGINDTPALSAADAGLVISDGAPIAREIADVIVESDCLEDLVRLRQLSRALMDRIDGNYHLILGFNSLLILLGGMGILQPTATALLHNGSTIAIGMHSMTDLMDETVTD